LRDVYTSGIAESLLNTPNIVHALFGSGLFGNTHLRELVARYISQDMLAAIAAEHAKGRRLLIVTTNLDTQRTVIWDMGRIATIGSPRRWVYSGMCWPRPQASRWFSRRC
jgi:hypothetical protein